MLDNERRAHDLTILYMQLEIKEERIVIPYEEDIKGFTDEYQNLYLKFMAQLESRQD